MEHELLIFNDCERGPMVRHSTKACVQVSGLHIAEVKRPLQVWHIKGEQCIAANLRLAFCSFLVFHILFLRLSHPSRRWQDLSVL